MRSAAVCGFESTIDQQNMPYMLCLEWKGKEEKRKKKKEKRAILTVKA
jgi:hypothetical protein